MYRTTRLFVILMLPWCLPLCVVYSEEEGTTVTPASNEDPEMKEVGQRPYQMAERREERAPQFDFENLSGWQVACRHGAEATLVRTREQQLWGQFVGKLTYEGTSKDSVVEIVPPKPIPIPDDSTAVNLWMLFDDHSFRAKGVTPAVLYFRVEDAQGDIHDVPINSLRRLGYPRWFLGHKRLPEMKRPAKFVSLDLRDCSNSKQKRLYLDSLCFYNEALKPLEFKYTLDQIKEEVPFPTTPDTILPPSSVSSENDVRQEGDRYVFSCKGPDGTLQYYYEPYTGTLSDVTAIHNGETPFQPAAGGGPVLFAEGKEFKPDDPSVTRRLLQCELKDRKLVARWRYSVGGVSADVDMIFRIKNRSLIVDFASNTRDFAGLSLGHSAGTPGAKTVEVPYLTFTFYQTKGQPYVLYWRGLFVSSMLDWYNSDASKLYGGSGVVTDTTASYNGGSEYIPRTDGTRNPLRERLFITASPVFPDVLPNIPNPPSPMREVLAPLFRLRLTGDPSVLLPRLRAYKAYGLDRMFVEFTFFAITWDLRDTKKKRRDQFKRLIAETKRLGYDRVALYTQYVEIIPGSASFSSDDVALSPDGNWNQRCWPGTYSYKSMRAVEKQEQLAAEIRREFGVTGSFIDVVTCTTPWAKVDYDARVPGAGMFASYFYAFGKLLLNERKVYGGPVYSEGTMHWMYAGLADGNRAEIRQRGKENWQVPFLLDFDLLRIHPLEADNGVGPLGICPRTLEGFSERGGHAVAKVLFRSPASDRALAATIAFGHAGDIRHITSVDEGNIIGLGDSPAANIWRMIKTYYMIQQLQERYIMVPVVEIRYHHNDKLLTTSEAIATDAYKESQVYVKYTNGLEVYVNGSWDKPWRVNAGGQDYLLPPAGFVAAMPDELLVYSVEVDGKRVEYVNSPEYVYADARGAPHVFPELETDGAVAIKRDGDSLTAIIASPDVTKLTIDVGRLLPHPVPEEIAIEACDIEDNRIRRSKHRLSAGRIAIPLAEGAVSYRIRPLGDGGGG